MDAPIPSVSRTSTDSYRKRLFAAFLITLALYCIVGGAFVLLPKVALFLSPGGSGGGNGVLFLGMVPGSGVGGQGGTGEENDSSHVASPRTESAPASRIASPDTTVVRTDEADTPANDAIATVARNRAPVEADRLASSESANPEETDASGSGSASGSGGTGSADGPSGAGGPGYGTGGNGSGGSFVDAVGDATTAPFISWVDRSIRKRLYYPEKARLRNLEGTVTLGMAVPADGSRCEVVLAKSSGHEVLDHAAIGLVRSLFPAKVAPGRDFSAPVRIRYTLVDN